VDRGRKNGHQKKKMKVEVDGGKKKGHRSPPARERGGRLLTILRQVQPDLKNGGQEIKNSAGGGRGLTSGKTTS